MNVGKFSVFFFMTKRTTQQWIKHFLEELKATDSELKQQQAIISK